MKPRWIFALFGCLTVACHRTQTIYATTEGLYDPGAPSQLRPARVLAANLRDRHVGGLAIHVEDLIDTRPGPFEVALYTDRFSRVSRVDTIAHEGVFYLGELSPGVYVGRVRRVGFNQRSFRVQITPGYVDAIDVHLGWSR